MTKEQISNLLPSGSVAPNVDSGLWLVQWKYISNNSYFLLQIKGRTSTDSLVGIFPNEYKYFYKLWKLFYE